MCALNIEVMKMKKTILIGVSIATVLAILLAAVALGFGDTSTKFNAFKAAETDNTSASAPPEDKAAFEAQTNTEISEIAIKGAIQQAQSDVSFRIIEPMYIPSGYKFESVGGKKFVGATNDIDMVSFSYKNGDEQLELKEVIIIVKTKQKTEPPTLPKDTREIVNINGIEGRYSEENDIKFLGWKIRNLSLSVTSWKNEGQNQTSSSLSKEEMIKIAESVREKTPEEAIAEAQTKVSFKIIQPAYIPAGYRMNTAQTSGTKFRGVNVELEQASIFYIKGDEFFMKNEYLTLGEQLITKDDTEASNSNIPWKFVDINGVQGRFLEESDGVKSLSWKMGNINYRISSYAYKETYSENESGFTGTSLGMEEMIKMARSIKEKTAEVAIAEAQAKVSFKILKPSYVPSGYALNIPQVSGTKFRGSTLEAEQAMLPYTNGKETLNLKELLTINDTTPVSKSTAIPEDTREIVDINGIKGRFSVEQDGMKYLNWKIGELSLTISSLTYNSNNITGSSLSKEEMIKMARSIK